MGRYSVDRVGYWVDMRGLTVKRLNRGYYGVGGGGGDRVEKGGADETDGPGCKGMVEDHYSTRHTG